MTVVSYFRPETLPEALDLLDRHGPALLVMAGGTVAMPLVNDGISLPEAVMSLRRAGLDGVEAADGRVRIGATTTLTTLAGQSSVPLLADAARATASWAVRNLATVGGNVFTPPPGGDVAVALLALDARLTLASAAGRRSVPLEAFHTGFLTNQLADGELLVDLQVPRTSDPTTFIRFARKHANSPAVVTVAARVRWAGGRVAEARVALGAVGPHPLRARAAERVLTGSVLEAAAVAEAAAAAADEAQPFTDAVATDWYRRRMTRLFVGRALERLATAGDGGQAR